MRKVYLSAILAFSFLQAVFAQDNSIKNIQTEATRSAANKPDSLRDGWTKGAYINLSFAQGSSSNWAAGAEDFSMSINSSNSLFAFYKKGKDNWDNTLDMYYGMVKTSSQGLRKNDDRFDLLSRYGRQLGNSHWYASALVNFRSQFSDGRNYYVSPTTGKDTSELVSTLLSPAYIVVSPGLEYRPVPYFNVFISPVSSRWVISTNKQLAPSYGIDSGKNSIYEIGAYMSASFNKEILKNVVYKSRIDLYANYRHNPQNVDVYWTNAFAMKINRWLSATYSLDMIYDDDAHKPDGSRWGLQVKSLLGVGLAFKVLDKTK